MNAERKCDATEGEKHRRSEVNTADPTVNLQGAVLTAKK